MDGSVDTRSSSKASLLQSDIGNKMGVTDDKVYGDVARFFFTDEINDDQVEAYNTQNKGTYPMTTRASMGYEEEGNGDRIELDSGRQGSQ
ncbi:unnamed protein product [Ilex paraguariensis]|uniref:Uncharacterized protein n=1 Tax=Ilex paraguariensis TaxID=185542 RepID=A0ABC8TTZ6_9AQUA